jgi:hypothetical protein
MNRKKETYLFKGVTKQEKGFADDAKPKRLAHFTNARTADTLAISERYALSVLMEIEATLDRLPPIEGGIHHLFNRVKAGFQIPKFIENSEISPERLSFVMDLMRGSLGQYPPVDIRAELNASTIERLTRKQFSPETNNNRDPEI